MGTSGSMDCDCIWWSSSVCRILPYSHTLHGSNFEDPYKDGNKSQLNNSSTTAIHCSIAAASGTESPPATLRASRNAPHAKARPRHHSKPSKGVGIWLEDGTSWDWTCKNWTIIRISSILNLKPFFSIVSTHSAGYEWFVYVDIYWSHEFCCTPKLVEEPPWQWLGYLGLEVSPRK